MFSDVLSWHEFVPSMSKTDIWMSINNVIYDKVAFYVDDLLISAQDPSSISRPSAINTNLSQKELDLSQSPWL
jgi:hypothetical protein